MANIITVSREFGSGGRELGKRLADALGFAYYDREIVTTLSKETGMDADVLEQELEQGVQANFPFHFAQSFSQLSFAPDTSVNILALQTKLIKEIAEKGDCVIVGRAADSILEEYHPFRVFVCADEASKLERCRQRAPSGENLTDREILHEMKRIDRARAFFHDTISDHQWGEKDAYDLCINTSNTVIKSVVPAIAAYYRLWKETA
ncbi:MAG: cytidylate kinase-like family protein [Oscillospiraceae bacterium]|nr:cytidylate kinase-like family protein [Oscillospiraceae bacterium]